MTISSRNVVKFMRRISGKATLEGDMSSSVSVVDRSGLESGRNGPEQNGGVMSLSMKNGIEDTNEEMKRNENSETNDREPNLKGEIFNIAFLLLLCIMQGIPIGIAMATKTYVQNTHMSYYQQAKYSLVDLPYSLKLLWSPLVDVAYSRRIGKRKTWVIPIQLAIGLMFIFVGFNINTMLMKDGSHMTMLTFVFFCMNILVATHDIAIDGWSLTILRRENIGYASTCSTSGQALGATIGYTLFILLESEKFSNNWLRFTKQTGGIVSKKGFLCFWGLSFIVITTCIGLFKKEKFESSNKVIPTKVMQTYKQVWEIINLQTMKKFAIVMLSYEVIFSSMGSSVSNPKFMEYGMDKEDIVLVDMTLIPIKIIFPIFIAKYATGPTPLKMFYNVVPFRLLLGISYGVLVYYTPYFLGGEHHKSLYFFPIYEFHRIFRMVLSIIMYLGVQAFFSRISDPQIGGTYMSILNTLWYLGVAVARIVALGLLNSLTIKQCSTDKTNVCWSKTDIKNCTHAGGQCDTLVDGYFIEVCIGTGLGIIWYIFLNRMLKNLQYKRPSDWQVHKSGPVYKLDNTISSLPDLIVTETSRR